MRRIHEVGAAEWAALVRMLPLVLVARLAIAILPFAVVMAVIQRIPARRDGRRPAGEGVRRRLWAIRALALRLFAGRPCLPEALASMVVLRRAGYPANLKIGVHKGPSGSLHAHAWVESGADVIAGGVLSPQRFTVLRGQRDAPS